MFNYILYITHLIVQKGNKNQVNPYNQKLNLLTLRLKIAS